MLNIDAHRICKDGKATPTALKLNLPIYIDKHADIDINNQFSILLTNLLLTSNVESESTYNITSTSVNRTLNSNFQRFFLTALHKVN